MCEQPSSATSSNSSRLYRNICSPSAPTCPNISATYVKQQTWGVKCVSNPAQQPVVSYHGCIETSVPSPPPTYPNISATYVKQQTWGVKCVSNPALQPVASCHQGWV